MIFFHNDYNEMCHPKVLEAMAGASAIQMQGYGADEECAAAAELIRKHCCNENLSVHFLVGGTQANLIVIAAALRPHHAVLAANSAHIHVHETGAVEATGHKIIALDSPDGKLTAQQIQTAVCGHKADGDREHTAKPKLVYISNPTELGTIYSLAELKEISVVCRTYGLYLFVDGARLGYALAANGNDVSLADLAELTDAFYIGGTKVGAMFGEAVVIANPQLSEDFRYLIKQRGGMLAKGWLLGLQFKTLLDNELYWQIAAHANRLADQLRDTLRDLGYSLYVEGVTNQIFPILPDAVLDELAKDFTFSQQCRIDEQHMAVRFCTSWATKQEHVDALCAALRNLSK